MPEPAAKSGFRAVQNIATFVLVVLVGHVGNSGLSVPRSSAIAALTKNEKFLHGGTMKQLFALMLPPVALIIWAGAPALGQEKLPTWAYPVNPPDFKAPADDGTQRRVPGSNQTLTLTQARDLFFCSGLASERSSAAA
jgi:hypothetical protein